VRTTAFCDFRVCGTGRISITTDYPQANGQRACFGQTELRVFNITSVGTLSLSNQIKFAYMEDKVNNRQCASTQFNTTGGRCQTFTVEQGCYVGSCNATTFISGSGFLEKDGQLVPNPTLAPAQAPNSAPTPPRPPSPAPSAMPTALASARPTLAPTLAPTAGESLHRRPLPPSLPSSHGAPAPSCPLLTPSSPRPPPQC
jgi:hypothetical protein